MVVKLSDETKTLFKFRLPFAVPVPDGVYPIRIGANLGKISIKRIQRKTSKAEDETSASQLVSDKYGVSGYSALKVLVPKKVSMTEEGRGSVLIEPNLKRLKAKEMVIRIVNRFIETTKNVTANYWVEPLRYQDILDFQAYFLDGKKKYSVKTPKLEASTNEITAVAGPKLEQLKDALASDHKFDLCYSFLLDSKDACSKGNYILATIEAVTALETALYQSILEQGKNANVHPNDLKRLIATIGSTGDLDAAVKMLSKGLGAVDSETVKDCKGALTVRNNILQKSARNVYSTDTEKRITAIEKMIDYLQRS